MNKHCNMLMKRMVWANINIVFSGEHRGMIFVSSARQGGGGWQLLNFKSQGGDTFRGETILGSHAGGGGGGWGVSG